MALLYGWIFRLSYVLHDNLARQRDNIVRFTIPHQKTARSNPDCFIAGYYSPAPLRTASNALGLTKIIRITVPFV